MALTALGIPSQITLYATPLDAMWQFANAQTLTATGAVNNVNSQLDLGSANPQSTVGRTEGIWVMDITALTLSSTQTYQMALIASNDVAFGAGNVELLAFHDFAAAAAGRIITTTLGATPTIPPTNLAGTIIQIPFTNLMQRIYYRFIRCFATLGGTTPSITLSSWISKSGVDV